jgi:hypothetical protein
MTSREPIQITVRRLRDKYLDAASSGEIGARTLTELAECANACCNNPDDGKAAVAAALTALLWLYADNWDEAIVTGRDQEEFVANCQPTVSEAIDFIAGKKDADALQIAAALARCMVR